MYIDISLHMNWIYVICSDDSDDNDYDSIGDVSEPTIKPAVQNVAGTFITPPAHQESGNSSIESAFIKELEATTMNPSIDQEYATSLGTPANGISLTTSIDQSTLPSSHKPVTNHLSSDTIEIGNNFPPAQKTSEIYIDL